MNNKLKWHLITIDDPAFLKGKSILDIITLIRQIIPVQSVILDYIFGTTKNGLIYSSLKEKNLIRELDTFLRIICDVNQFDWGDFFLFKEYPTSWDNREGELYPFVIRQTDTTVRAIDNQYIYIYTPYQEIVDALKMKYTIECHKIDFLENLDYPE